MTINGGTLALTCNGDGDTAVDCDGTYTNNGGDLTTNDGSENAPNQMGGTGGCGGMGGQADPALQQATAFRPAREHMSGGGFPPL